MDFKIHSSPDASQEILVLARGCVYGTYGMGQTQLAELLQPRP